MENICTVNLFEYITAAAIFKHITMLLFDIKFRTLNFKYCTRFELRTSRARKHLQKYTKGGNIKPNIQDCSYISSFVVENLH